MKASTDNTFSINIVGEPVKRFALGWAKVVGVNVKVPRPAPHSTSRCVSSGILVRLFALLRVFSENTAHDKQERSPTATAVFTKIELLCHDENMQAYSYDLRQRVLRAVDQGRPRAEIVTMFAISLATLKRHLKRRRETGDVRAKPIPGRPAKKGAALQAGLLSHLETYPDASLAEHCQIWETTEAHAGQLRDDESCDPAFELDMQEKDVAGK